MRLHLIDRSARLLSFASFFLAVNTHAIAAVVAPDNAPEQSSGSNIVDSGPPATPSVDGFSDLVAASLRPVPGGLTADEVARAAVESAPSVETLRAELMSTAASVDETLSRFVPNVKGSATYSRLSPADIDFGGGGASVGASAEGPLRVDPVTGLVVGSDGQAVGAVSFGPLAVPLDNFSLQASVTVPILDYVLRLLPAKRGAQAETRSAVLQRDAEKQQVELRARTAFYDWVRALAQIAVVEQTLASLRARLADAEVALRAGVATPTDVARIDESVQLAALAVLQAKSFRDLAARNLQVITGSKVAPVHLGEDILAEVAVLESVDDLDALVREAKEQRLEVAALEASDEALKQANRAVRAGYFPRLDAFFEAGYANPNQRFFPLENVWQGNWTLGVSASWQLQTFLQSRSQQKSLVAARRRLAASLEALYRGIEMEVASAYQELRRAKSAIDINTKTLQIAEAVYMQQSVLYSAGELTTTDLIAAETDRLNASLRSLNAQIDLRVARLKLLRASGRVPPMSVEEDKKDARYERVGFTKRSK
jgi:outer membrane protein TolC